LGPFDLSLSEILQKKVSSLKKTKRAKLDHVVIAAAVRQWHRQCVQISDSNLANLMPQLRWDNF